MQFLRKRALDSESCAAPLAKEAKAQAKVERLASYDVLKVWENSLVGHTTEGLARFKEPTLAPGVAPSLPGFLVLSLDWEQKQWCALWYAQLKERL